MIVLCPHLALTVSRCDGSLCQLQHSKAALSPLNSLTPQFHQQKAQLSAALKMLIRPQRSTEHEDKTGFLVLRRCQGCSASLTQQHCAVYAQPKFSRLLIYHLLLHYICLQPSADKAHLISLCKVHLISFQQLFCKM